MKNPNNSSSGTCRAQMRAEREALKAKYSDFFGKVSTLMFEHDPIGINFIDNVDEYDPEAGSVIPRIEACRSEAELTAVLHQEFCHWFGEETAGPESHYQALSSAIWALAVATKWHAQRGVA